MYTSEQFQNKALTQHKYRVEISLHTRDLLHTYTLKNRLKLLFRNSFQYHCDRDVVCLLTNVCLLFSNCSRRVLESPIYEVKLNK